MLTLTRSRVALGWICEAWVEEAEAGGAAGEARLWRPRRAPDGPSGPSSRMDSTEVVPSTASPTPPPIAMIEPRRLELSRVEVDLPALVRATVERTADATSGHEVDVEVRSGVPPLLADPGRLEQVLTNLLS